MLDGLFFLLTLSVLMFISSLLAGLVPLSMNLSQSRLRLISVIGMGILVGTSLIVIIPEGIEAVYSASSGQIHARRGVSGIIHASDSRLSATNVLHSRWTNIARQSEDLNVFNDLPGPVISPKIPAVQSSTPLSSTTASSPLALPETHDEPHNDPPTFWIGLSLITGFILMYLIDKLPHHASNSLQRPVPTRHISLNDFSINSSSISPATDVESSAFLRNSPSITSSPKSLATTLGLVIHATADGIALGASTTSTPTLGLMIFLAIMVHKAPAAFGLSSVLLYQGVSKRAARSHLLAFSLAAPIGALATFFIVAFLGGGNGEDGEFWTGLLLLFSGGTFLYVAMHAMQGDGGHDHSVQNGQVEGQIGKGRKSEMSDTLGAVVGMLIPLLTQFGHHH